MDSTKLENFLRSCYPFFGWYYPIQNQKDYKVYWTKRKEVKRVAETKPYEEAQVLNCLFKCRCYLRAIKRYLGLYGKI